MMPFNLSVCFTATCWLLRRQMSCGPVSANYDLEPDHHGRTERAGRSRQHQLLQQPPAAKEAELHDHHARTGCRGDAHQRGGRLRALKIAFFAVGSVALLAIFPLRQSPDYKPGKMPGDELEGAGEEQLA